MKCNSTLKYRCFWAALALGLTIGSTAPSPAAPPPSEWKLVWSDEFDGKELDRTKWDFDISNGFYNYDANMWISGWGNDELQYYTKEADNAFVRDGMLRYPGGSKESHGLGCHVGPAQDAEEKRELWLVRQEIWPVRVPR